MTSAEFNRHQTPSGGWIFRQPQTGWTAPTPVASTFSQTVNLIIAHRKQNPAITAKHKLATNPEAVALELEQYTRKRLGLQESPLLPFQETPSQSNGGHVAAGNWSDRGRQMATGAMTLKDWLADGPVTHELAELRAATCIACPMHKRGDWASFFTTPVANLIRKQVEEKSGMSLNTSRDKELGICGACGCPMPVKVHVKKSTIMAHIKEPELKKLDPGCWILTEA